MDTKDKVQSQRRWVREEVCLLVAEYFHTRSLSNEEIQKSIEMVSEVLRNREKVLTSQKISDTFRNVNGIKMQFSRIRCIDPDTSFAGMQGTKLQKEIVNEYLCNPEKIKAEANQTVKKYGQSVT